MATTIYNNLLIDIVLGSSDKDSLESLQPPCHYIFTDKKRASEFSRPKWVSAKTTFKNQISLTLKPMILITVLYCFLPNFIIVLGCHFPNIYKHIFSWIILIRFFKTTLKCIDSLTIKSMSTMITFDASYKMRNGVTLLPHIFFSPIFAKNIIWNYGSIF